MPTEVRQVRVAIITADPSARETLLDALEQRECIPTVIDSELSLLKATKEWSWRESIIVLFDLSASPIDHAFVLAKLKIASRTNHILLALIAEEGERDEVIKALETEAADWLSKPFDPVLLRTRLNLYLENAQLRNQSERVRQDVAIFRNEMTNPYVSIKGYAETLLDGTEGPLNDKQHQWVANIRRSANFWVRVRDAFSQIMAIDTTSFRFHFTRVGITKVAEESLKMVNEEIHRGDLDEREHRITVSLPDELPLVQADELRLMQIVVILLENAYQYTPPRGEIILSAKEVTEDEQRFVYIAVEDNGIGIDPIYTSRLFQRFFRAEEVWETVGSGLHLHIAKVLIEGMGGRIWFESEPNRGSTFYVSIPVAT